MENYDNLKSYYLKNVFIAEIFFILISILGFILTKQEITEGNYLFKAGLILLAFIYFFDALNKGPKNQTNRTKEVGYQTFLIKLIYLGLTVDIIAILWIVGYNKSDMALLWLTLGITTFILFILYEFFFLIRYGRGDYLKIFDFIRYIVISCILIVMYINRGFKPPFFN